MFRATIKSDIEEIMQIIRDAQQYLRLEGIPQWQNNYPNEGTIEEDIMNNNSYVLIKDNKIAGTVALVFDGERTYDKIYEGKWLSQGEYCAVHRIAVSSKYKGNGLAAEIIKYAEEICHSKGIKSIRVDTHRNNISMQKMLEKNGFMYCGVIYLTDNSERIAFEKII